MFGVASEYNGQVYLYKTPDHPISEELADAISSDIDLLVRGGMDIDRACKMVYGGNGIEYIILEGGS